MWHENERVRSTEASKNPFFECAFHEITTEFVLELVQKAGCKKLNMVSWIYSEMYILKNWTGVTKSIESGPNAVKMILVSRIQK